MKTFYCFQGLADPRHRHAMVYEDVEAHILHGGSQLLGERCLSARFIGQVIADVERRDQARIRLGKIVHVKKYRPNAANC
jgi:hypothetical protein